MLLRCPNCGHELKRQENSYRCDQGHSFDISAKGYVNLLLKHSANPGDDGLSLTSRAEFLAKGYYEKLALAIRQVVSENLKAGESFLDAGCGTGYYLHYLQGLGLQLYATDIAKKGVAMSAKANKEAVCFVGNVFHLPLDEGALDGLMSVFCPYSAEEFSRVVREGGYVIAVTPGPQHLYDLKKIVYDTPYFNEGDGYDLPDFRLVSQQNVTYTIHLSSNQNINSLWRMMPYYHTTSRENNERLLKLEECDTTVDFLLQLFKKEGCHENH